MGPERVEKHRLIVSVAERLKESKLIRGLGAKVSDLQRLRAISLKLLPGRAANHNKRS